MRKTPKYLTFIQTPMFARMTKDWLDDGSLNALELALIENPEVGDVVKQAGGVRKIRVALPGRGKRGSARVIYLYRSTTGVIYFILGYQKNTQADLTPKQRKALKAFVEQLEER